MNISLLKKFCDKHGVAVSTFQKAAELLNDPDADKLLIPSKGMLVHSIKKNRTVVLYDDKLSIEEKYFTFAHEIGHHVMQHLTERNNKRTAAEIEADVFASVLMALSVFAETKETT